MWGSLRQVCIGHSVLRGNHRHVSHTSANAIHNHRGATQDQRLSETPSNFRSAISIWLTGEFSRAAEATKLVRGYIPRRDEYRVRVWIYIFLIATCWIFTHLRERRREPFSRGSSSRTRCRCTCEHAITTWFIVLRDSMNCRGPSSFSSNRSTFARSCFSSPLRSLLLSSASSLEYRSSSTRADLN